MAGIKILPEIAEDDQSSGYLSENSDSEPSLMSRWHFGPRSLGAYSPASKSSSSSGQESVISVSSDDVDSHEKKRILINENECENMSVRSNSENSDFSDTKSEAIKQNSEEISSDVYESMSQSILSKISDTDSSTNFDSWEVDSKEPTDSSLWSTESDETWTVSEMSDQLPADSSLSQSERDEDWSGSETSVQYLAVPSPPLSSSQRDEDWTGSEASVLLSALSILSVSTGSEKLAEYENWGLDSDNGLEIAETDFADSTYASSWSVADLPSIGEEQSLLKADRDSLDDCLGLIPGPREDDLVQKKDGQSLEKDSIEIRSDMSFDCESIDEI